MDTKVNKLTFSLDYLKGMNLLQTGVNLVYIRNIFSIQTPIFMQEVI